MSLALLNDVAGRLGGLLGGPLPGPPIVAPALDMPATVCGMLALRPIDGARVGAGPSAGVGGVLVGRGKLATLAGVGGGGGAPLAVKTGGVERGGGGVAAGAGAAVAPAALLIHFPRLGSNTNWLASPRLALTGLVGAAAPGVPAASVLLPPNQPPNQPDLRFCATGRAAMLD
jgi:hypothetical protein